VLPRGATAAEAVSTETAQTRATRKIVVLMSMHLPKDPTLGETQVFR
jgi:hypothetical protein